MSENEISKIIVDSAIELHLELGGPGLIEGVYDEAMEAGWECFGIAGERHLTQSRKDSRAQRSGNEMGSCMLTT
jgi:hypothetical protein